MWVRHSKYSLLLLFIAVTQNGDSQQKIIFIFSTIHHNFASSHGMKANLAGTIHTENHSTNCVSP